MAQPIIKQWDPMTVINLKVGSVALNFGDLCSYESQAVVLMDAAGEDATFCGLFGGKVGTTDAGLYVPIFTKCIAQVDLTSATYDFGATLKYTSKNKLVAAAGADSIANYWDIYATSKTSADCFFDVQNIGKLFVAPSA